MNLFDFSLIATSLSVLHCWHCTECIPRTLVSCECAPSPNRRWSILTYYNYKALLITITFHLLYYYFLLGTVITINASCHWERNDKNGFILMPLWLCCCVTVWLTISLSLSLSRTLVRDTHISESMNRRRIYCSQSRKVEKCHLTAALQQVLDLRKTVHRKSSLV